MDRDRIIQALAVILLIAGAAYFHQTREPKLEPLRFQAVERQGDRVLLRLAYSGAGAGKINPVDPDGETRVRLYRCDRPDTLSRTPSYSKDVTMLDQGTPGQPRPQGVSISVKEVSCVRISQVWEGSNYVEGPPVDWNNSCVSYVVGKRHPLEATRIRAATAPGDLAPVGRFCDATASASPSVAD